MLICNLKIVSIDFYTLQHFLYQDFAFLVIGESPSFLRFHSQTISEVEEEGKKKKNLLLEAICKRESDSVWKESHFYFLHLFHYSKGVNFNWHFPTKKIILQGKKMEAITYQKYVEGFSIEGKDLLDFKYFQPRQSLCAAPGRREVASIWPSGGVDKHVPQPALSLTRNSARDPLSSIMLSIILPWRWTALWNQSGCI